MAFRIIHHLRTRAGALVLRPAVRLDSACIFILTAPLADFVAGWRLSELVLTMAAPPEPYC